LGAPTVEELVRQSLEPKIQEWLNANLKEMVERLVQQEIDKISRRT
jgi:cell pole-organizing protein PopZ